MLQRLIEVCEEASAIALIAEIARRALPRPRK
jgi:hypothetical protein